MADKVRPTARAAVSELRELGLRPVMLTGDTEGTARRIAEELGVDEVLAGARRTARPTPCAICSGRRKVAMVATA